MSALPLDQILAAGYTLLHDEHVRVDIVYSKLTPRRRAWLDFVLFWVFFFPSCALVIYTAWPFVRIASSQFFSCPERPSGTRGSVRGGRESCSLACS